MIIYLILLLACSRNINLNRTKDTQVTEAQSIFEAAERNSYEDLKRLLESNDKFDINSKNEEGKSLLHIACNKLNTNISRQNIQIVELILNRGININITDKMKKTALIYTCSYEMKDNNIQLEIINLLLSMKNIDINHRGINGDTALAWLCYTPHIRNENLRLNILKALIKRKVSINTKNEFGKTPLIVSSINPNIRDDNIRLEIVKLLLNEGADIDIEDNEGQTAIIRVCYTKSLNNKEIRLKVLKTLINNKGNINIQDKEGRTALMNILYKPKIKDNNTFLEVIKLLIESGADVNIQDKLGESALHIACKLGDIDIIRILLSSKDIHVKLKDNDGYTPLHYAVKNAKILNLLLNNETDVNFIDSDCKIPLTKLVCSEDIDKDEIKKMIDDTLLESQNVVIDTQYNRDKSLIKACHRMNVEDDNVRLEVIRELIRSKVINLNLRDSSGDTALMLAIRTYFIENDTVRLAIIQELLNAGADVNIQNHNKCTALVCSLATNSIKDEDIRLAIIKHLIQAGADSNISWPFNTIRYSTTLLIYVLNGIGNKFEDSTKLAIINELIKAKDIDVNLQDENGTVALVAALGGRKIQDDNIRLEIIRSLLKKRANPNISNKNGIILLMAICSPAIQDDDIRLDIVKELIKAKSELNDVHNNEFTDLKLAIFSSRIKNDNIRLDMVKLLLEKGADPNIRTTNGTALMTAISTDKIKDENIRLDIIKSLLEKGANPNLKDNEGYSALYYLVKLKESKLLTLLLRYKADINILDNNGNSLLHLLLSGKLISEPLNSNEEYEQYINKYNKIIMFLLDNGIDVNIQNHEGFIPIYYAVKNNSIKFTDLLLKNGSKINENYSSTLIHEAFKNENNSIVELLLESVVSPETNNNDNNILLAALESNRKDIFDLLINSSSLKERLDTLIKAINSNKEEYIESLIRDLDAQDEKGNTILHYAVRDYLTTLAPLLIKKGANLNIKNNKGLVPYNYALANIFKKGKLTANSSIIKIIKLLLDRTDLKNIDNKALEYTLALDSNELVDTLISKNSFILNSLVLLAPKVASSRICTYIFDQVKDIDLHTDEEGNTILHLAILHKNIDAIKAAIGRVNINFKNLNDETPLHLACELAAEVDNIEIVKFLINNHPIKSIKTEDKDSKAKDRKVVTNLKDKKTKINIRDKNGFTPLYRAFINRHGELIKYLLNKKANPYVLDNEGYSVVHRLVLEDDIEMLKFITNSKFDINMNQRDARGNTPLHLAIIHKKESLAKALILDNEVNINVQNCIEATPLHYAAQENLVELVELLISKKVNVNIRDRNGDLPLHYAVASNNLELTQLLLENKTLINMHNFDGETALYMATKHKKYQLAELLLDKGADCKARNSNYKTPVHEIIKNEDKQMLDLFIVKADKDLSLKEEIAILIVESNSKYMCSLLPTIFKDLANYKGHHNGAILNYAASKNLYAIEVLIDVININSQNKGGERPLNVALNAKRFDIANQLLKSPHVEILATDKSGKTPMYFAILMQHEEIVKEMLKRLDLSNKEDCLKVIKYAAEFGNMPICKEVFSLIGLSQEILDLLRKYNKNHNASKALYDLRFSATN